MANTAISVTSLDFDVIKNSLKEYIKAQPQFLDYNFEGSVASLLLDILAFNTYQNGFYTSMVGNEMFLDSAQIRANVVSRAKQLGYIPRTARGASTELSVTLSPSNTPDSIVVPKDSQFSATLNGEQLIFVTPQAYTIPANNSTYIGNITITEGRPLTHRFTVDTSNPQRFILPNQNIDSTSISVVVQNSSSDTATTNFTLANDITEVTGTSNVFYFQEYENQQIELYFGDGVLGKALENGNIVIVNYRVCNGTDGNQIATFTSPSSLGGVSNFTVSVSANTSGGSNTESIDSIKFSAPKNFETQNRAVLAKDYERIIKADNGDIQTLRVWGGEDNNPPVYGKVFISAKPTNGTVLSQQKKELIISQLKQKNVITAIPEFIDPTYIYIIPTIQVNYDSRLTSLTDIEVRNKVISAVQAFELSDLSTFENNRFRFSKFQRVIDDADNSIQSNHTTIKLQKRFKPNFTTSTKYTIDFDVELNRLSDVSTVSSTEFTLSGRSNFMEDDGSGNIQTFYNDSLNQKIISNSSQGTIDYSNGTIILNSFLPTAATNDEIRVMVIPEKYDVVTERYQLMLLSSTQITMFNEATGISSSAVTVSTAGSVTQINETAIGTLV